LDRECAQRHERELAVADEHFLEQRIHAVGRNELALHFLQRFVGGAYLRFQRLHARAIRGVGIRHLRETAFLDRGNLLLLALHLRRERPFAPLGGIDRDEKDDRERRRSARGENESAFARRHAVHL